MKYSDGLYTGEHQNGMKHGDGNLEFTDGSNYDGEFKDG